MFNFLLDAGNYEDRCVGNHNTDDLFVSTARVSDGTKPYETAIEHADYNNGSMVIVENYNTKEEAEQGHSRWLETMQNEPLPLKLTDCGNALLVGGITEDFPRTVEVNN